MTGPTWIDKDLGRVTGTDEQIQAAANAYLETVITNPDSPPLDRSLSSNVSAAPADLAGETKKALVSTNILLQDQKTSEIEWYKEKDCGVRYDTGEDVTSSVYSVTNYIDIRAYKEITYKRHKTTSSAVNTGIAFYEADKTFITGSGVAGIGSAAAAGVTDNTVDVPAGAAYVRCTIFKDQTTGAFAISGKSRINRDITDIQEDIVSMSEQTEETFITPVDGYTSNGMTFSLTEDGLEISGTSSANANRYYSGLNGNGTLVNTTTNFGNIIEPGLYKARLKILDGTPSGKLVLAVSSTTATGDDRQEVKDGDYFSITTKSGIAVKIPGGTAFGTSESPTVLDFGAVKQCSRDDYARKTAENAANHFGYFVRESVAYANGSIDTSDGTDTSSATNRLRTGYCKLENGYKITVPDGWMYGACLYSSESSSGYVRFTGWKYKNFETREMDSTETYVRFVLKKTDDGDISAGDAENVVIEKFIPDDGILQAVVDLGIVQGSMNSSGGNSTTNADKRLRTGYIPLDPVYGFEMTVPSGWLVNYFLYTGNTSSTFFFESSTKSDDYRMSYDGASTANYVRFWIRKSDDSQITPEDATGISATFFYSKKEGENLNGLLYPSGTDQTAEIQKRLNAGRCELAPGSFYTTGVTMPEGAIFSGSGRKTKLYLTGTSAGTCIAMSKSCTVRNMEIIGSADEDNLSGTIGSRHGVSCSGSGSSETAWQCVISGCWIHGFTGGGILMYKTGTARAAKISDCYLFGNCVGLYIKDGSEYIHVNGCTMSKNYYGCINNGANNMISCCTFTSNEYGLMMGDTSGTDYGAAAKCEVSASNFGHNTTRSIYINNMVSSGIGFTGCYISENGAEIIASRSVNFTGCSMTDTFSLTVNGGGVILFTGCNFRNNFTVSDGKVSITSNDKVHFDGCYYYNGNECNPVS